MVNENSNNTNDNDKNDKNDKNKSNNDDDNFSDDDDDDDEVYNTPSAIIKNLYIAKDGVIKDESFGLVSRNILSKYISNQICFYVYCALRPFLTSSKQSILPPTILMIGTGFVGSTILKQLIDNECKPLIRIYSRGDAQTQHWSHKQVKCGTSISKLLKNHPADIVIMNSELTSTNTICKQLIPHIKPYTFFITSTFGLQRTRLFSLLKIPTIFRTYQDPDGLVNRFKDNYALELQEKQKELQEKQNETVGFNLLNPEQIKEQEMTLSRQKKGKESAVEKRLREAKEKEQRNKELGIIENDDSDEDISKSIVTASLLDDDDDEDDDIDQHEDLNEIEISADLIGKRLNDVRHLVFLLENYYALKGIPHTRARREALISIFGYVDEFESTCPVPLAAQKYITALAEEKKQESDIADGESKMDESVLTKDSGSHPHGKKLVPPVRELLLLKIMQSLFNNVADTFQKQLSKYILVVDLPQALELGSLSEFDTVSSLDANDKIFDELSEIRSLLRTPPPPEPIHSDTLIVHILEQDRKMPKMPNKIKNLIKSLGVSSDEESDLDDNIYDGYVEEEEETVVDEMNNTLQSEFQSTINNKFKLTTSNSPKKLTSFVDGDIAILSKLEQKQRDTKGKKKQQGGKLSRGTNSRGTNSRGINSRGEIKTPLSDLEGMIDIRKEMPPELDTPRRNAALRAGHIVEHNVRDATTILPPPSQYNTAASKNIRAMFIKEEPKEITVPKINDRVNYFSNDFIDDSLSQLSAPRPEAPVPTKK